MNHSGKAACKRLSACEHVCVCEPRFGSAPFQRDSCPLSKGSGGGGGGEGGWCWCW